MTVNFAKSLIVYAELSAALCGLVYWKKWRGSGWHWLTVFLVALFVFDFSGQQLSYKKLYAANAAYYKYFVIPFLFSGYFIIYQVLVEQIGKIGGWVALALFGCSWLAEITFLKQARLYTNSLAISVGTLLLLILVLRYFWRLMQSEKLVQFYWEMPFWFCTALSIFYLPMLPYFGLFNLLAKNYYHSLFLPYTWVFVCMNFAMYCVFALGFVLGKNNGRTLKRLD